MHGLHQGVFSLGREGMYRHPGTICGCIEYTLPANQSNRIAFAPHVKESVGHGQLGRTCGSMNKWTTADRLQVELTMLAHSNHKLTFPLIFGRFNHIRP